MKAIGGLLFLILTTSARSQVLIYSPSNPLTIPDADPNGLQTTMTVPASYSAPVSNVKVTLNLQGSAQDCGFAGDLYVALYHQGRAVVLLNRPGRDLLNPAGYDDTGDFHITLSDSAAHDVHRYQDFSSLAPSIGLTGQWQPDGRTANFNAVVSSDPRSAMLDQLNGTEARGQWVMFFADVSGGGVTELASWSIQFTVVPEIHGSTIGVATMLGLWAIGRRIVRASKLPQKRNLGVFGSIPEDVGDRKSFLGNCS